MSQTIDGMRAETVRLGGAALMVGGALNFLRMLPLALSDGFSFDILPPENLEEAVSAASLRGWHASHVMAFISVPLVIFGLVAAYQSLRDRGHGPLALAGVVGIAVGFASYGVAAVTDGLELPDAVATYLEAGPSEEAAAGVLAFHTHETAGNFGGSGFASIMVSFGLLAVAVGRARSTPWYGWVGVAISAIAALGYLTTLISVDLGDGIVVVLGLMGATLALLITLGAWMVRTPTTAASEGG